MKREKDAAQAVRSRAYLFAASSEAFYDWATQLEREGRRNGFGAGDGIAWSIWAHHDYFYSLRGRGLLRGMER